MLNCWCITWPVGFKRLIFRTKQSRIFLFTSWGSAASSKSRIFNPMFHYQTHTSLSWDRWIHLMLYHHISFTSILISSCNLRLGLEICVFPSRFPHQVTNLFHCSCNDCMAVFVFMADYQRAQKFLTTQSNFSFLKPPLKSGFEKWSSWQYWKTQSLPDTRVQWVSDTKTTIYQLLHSI